MIKLLMNNLNSAKAYVVRLKNYLAKTEKIRTSRRADRFRGPEARNSTFKQEAATQKVATGDSNAGASIAIVIHVCVLLIKLLSSLRELDKETSKAHCSVQDSTWAALEELWDRIMEMF